MAGIRSFNSNAPTVFKYPTWVSGLFYPAGAVVAVPIVNNAGEITYDFYAARNDVDNKTIIPTSNSGEWRRVHDVDQIDSDIINRLQGLDSDLLKINEDMDSDYRSSKDYDSDIYVAIDSEYRSRKQLEQFIFQRLDSEYRARMDGDSDARAYTNFALRDIDSDLKVVVARKNDSEWIRNLIGVNLDSEIRARISGDSDINVIIRQTIHNYMAKDSEVDSDFLDLKRRMDSDFRGAVRGYRQLGTDAFWGPQPWVTSTRLNLDTGTLTNHGQGYLWVVDQDNNSIYLVKDGLVFFSRSGDLTTTNVATGNTGEFIRGTQIEESPGTNADVTVYLNTSDPTPISSNANIFAVVDRLTVNQATASLSLSLDDALRRTVSTVVQMDSDISVLRNKDSDYDSDILQFRADLLFLKDARAKDRDDNDSDRIIQLYGLLDSEYRARKNTDSDIRDEIEAALENAIGDRFHDLFAFDSDITLRVDSEFKLWRDHDSDLRNGHRAATLRYVIEEFTAPIIGASPSIDFAASVTVTDLASAWVWNTTNNRLVIIDSEGNVSYDQVHLSEPTVARVGQTQWRRGADSLQNASILVNGVPSGNDDIWNVHIDIISKRFLEAGLVRVFVDSDITIHDVDSDNVESFEFVARRLSELDSEIQEAKNRDSDIISEFRIPVETITLRTGTNVYTLTNPLLNENTRWSYKTEIESNASIYNGIVNDHFEINHNGTAWEIEVDGVQGREFVDIFIGGSATVSGQAINVPWDDNSTVTISPLSTDTTAQVATQLYNALQDKSVISSVNTGTSSVSYSTEGIINPTGSIVLNGITFTFLENAVTDLGFYYKDADTITFRKK